MNFMSVRGAVERPRVVHALNEGRSIRRLVGVIDGKGGSTTGTRVKVGEVGQAWSVLNSEGGKV